MDIQSSLVSNGQPAEAVEPCERTLHNPPVAPQLLTAFHTSSGDTRGDTSPAQCFSVGPGIVSLISVQFHRTPAWPASLERRNGVNHLLQHGRVRHISPSTLQG